MEKYLEMSPTVRNVPGLKISNTQILKKQDIFSSYDSETNNTMQLKKNHRPRQLASINSASNLANRFGSVSVMKQVTVEMLLSSSESKDHSKSDRENLRISLPQKLQKWNELYLKNSEILSRIKIKKFENLRNTIDSSRKEYLERTSLTELVTLATLDSFLIIFQSFHDSCEEISNSKHFYEAKMQQILQENSSLKEKIEETLKASQKKYPNESSPLKSPEKVPKSQKPEFLQTKFELERIRLLERISLLEDHVLEMKKHIKEDEMAKEIESLKQALQHSEAKIDKLKQRNKQISYRSQLEISDLKSKLSEDSIFVKQSTDTTRVLNLKLESLDKSKQEVQARLLLSQERLQMLAEDYNKFITYREKYNRILEQLHTMKVRYNQLELEIIAGSASRQVDSVTWISVQDPIFEKVRAGFQPQSPAEKASFQSTSEYKLASPTYAGFLDLAEDKYGLEAQFSNWLEVSIRGIYDSKYYEHLSCSFETSKTPCRFPEFVYSWIGKFSINEKTREVTELEWWKKDSIDSLRIKLLLALRQANIKKVWELYTFQEFLNEELMLDELGFYLHCRHLMFKGPQLANAHGKYSTVHYVDRLHVNSLIDSLMPKLSSKEKSDLKVQLHAKSKNKQEGASEGIDSGFVRDI